MADKPLRRIYSQVLQLAVILKRHLPTSADRPIALLYLWQRAARERHRKAVVRRNRLLAQVQEELADLSADVVDGLGHA